jgi:hypothetical protein
MDDSGLAIVFSGKATQSLSHGMVFLSETIYDRL